MNIRNKSRVYPPLTKNLNFLPQFIFLISVILSIGTTYYVTGNILDSDASSELILSKEIAETGKILSQDWIYGSEFRILHMQLVYAPLFLFLNDWHLIRFIGALIMQATYVLSYAYLSRQAGFSKRAFYLGSALLLLPVSVAYGRIVLYHCHYLPNITMSFLILGLVLGFAREIKWNHIGTWMRLAMLALLSFLGGLNSIRQLMITHAPMILCILVPCFIEDAQNGHSTTPSILKPKNLRLFLCAGLAAFASLIGLLINTKVLTKYYESYLDPNANVLDFIDGSKLDDVLYGYFHQFGFRSQVGMISPSGILSILGLVIGVYVLIIVICKIKNYSSAESLEKTIVHTFFLYYTVVMFFVFAFTHDFSDFLRYLTLCLPWATPMLIDNLEKPRSHMSILHLPKLLSWGCVVILFLSGYANITYYNGSKAFNQPFEGLSFQNINKKEEMQGVSTFLTENGYDIGYADYWEANILTEITNGEVSMISIDGSFDEKNLWFCDCLTSRYLREAPCEKPFLLLPVGTIKYWEGSDSLSYCTLVYEDAYSCIYDINDLDSFIVTLRY